MNASQSAVISAEDIARTAAWLETEKVPQADGSVILYKLVTEDFLTMKGKVEETKWTPAKTVVHPDYDPTGHESGPGKFHACSDPEFCYEFWEGNYSPRCRLIAIQVKVADLYAWPNPRYPHKIVFRAGTVLYECDELGNPIYREDRATAVGPPTCGPTRSLPPAGSS